jgi:hypothetical protein
MVSALSNSTDPEPLYDLLKQALLDASNGFSPGFVTDLCKQVKKAVSEQLEAEKRAKKLASLVELVWHNDGRGYQCPSCSVYVCIPESGRRQFCPRCRLKPEKKSPDQPLVK